MACEYYTEGCESRGGVKGFIERQSRTDKVALSNLTARLFLYCLGRGPEALRVTFSQDLVWFPMRRLIASCTSIIMRLFLWLFPSNNVPPYRHAVHNCREAASLRQGSCSRGITELAAGYQLIVPTISDVCSLPIHNCQRPQKVAFKGNRGLR